MPTYFDPTTAYREDWQHLDGVEDATLHHRAANGETVEEYPVKVLIGGVANQDLQSFGQVQTTPTAPDGFLWLLPLPGGDGYPPGPFVDDAITRLSDGAEYMIVGVSHPRMGPYLVSLVEGRRNE